MVFEDVRFTNDDVLWVDSSLFDIFSFSVIKSVGDELLNEPFFALLTETTAHKYFQDKNPLDQTIRIRGRDYIIRGIVADPPSNSHLQFDVLASFASLTQTDDNILEKSGIAFPTYVLKREGADFEAFKQKTAIAADRELNEKFNPFGLFGEHSLQPLDRIYMHSGFDFETKVTGDIRHVYVFSFLALAVIVIAVFNFINLITAQSEKRMREIGMRKVMGASRKDLISQFIGESVSIAFAAFLLSLMLNELLINEFASLWGGTLRLEYWYNPLLLLGILSLVFITGVLAGFYPALYESGFQPMQWPTIIFNLCTTPKIHWLLPCTMIG